MVRRLWGTIEAGQEHHQRARTLPTATRLPAFRRVHEEGKTRHSPDERRLERRRRHHDAPQVGASRDVGEGLRQCHPQTRCGSTGGDAGDAPNLGILSHIGDDGCPCRDLRFRWNGKRGLRDGGDLRRRRRGELSRRMGMRGETFADEVGAQGQEEEGERRAHFLTFPCAQTGSKRLNVNRTLPALPASPGNPRLRLKRT